MKFTKLAAAATLALAAFAVQALPTASGSTTFKVKITITGTCDATAFNAVVSPGSDINFGTHPASLTTALTASNTVASSLDVRCSKNLPFEVALTPGNLNTAGAGVMLGTGTNTNTIAYQLRQPTVGVYPAFVAGTATSAVWGNVTAVNAFTALGNGLAVANKINLPVAANIAAPALDVQADAYIDTVTATLSY